ncbi:MAG: ACP S-malonyltransferase [Stellaceae bacterium]
MKRALVFPGQGSQTVGMGRSLFEAFAEVRYLFEEIDDALSQRLTHLMFEGPESDLTLTENAQPALLAVSMAAIRVLEKEGGLELPRHCAYVAGHSLGEYTALAAARALALADAVRLVKRRGQAMQQAVPVGAGAMAALMGIDVATAAAAAEEAMISEAGERQVCAVANDNAPGQVVISGHEGAVERAIAQALARGARRAIRLPVSAPFHSPLMAPAAAVMAAALGEVALKPPLVPLIANVTATPVRAPAEIRRRLVEQVTAMVRWRESVLFLQSEEVEEIVEVGAGRVLTGLVKRIAPELKARAVGTPAEAEALMKDL